MSTTTRSAALAAESSARDWLKVASIVLALSGVLIAGYLVISEATNTQTICPANGAFNCDLVQKSIYSKVGPIPVAVIGLVGYLAILAILLLESRVELFAERGKTIVFGMTLIGLLFSGYLTAMEAFVLHAWCVWCLGSAIVMLLLFGVSFARLWRAISEDAVEAEE
jgi:uncharacterized membrane protein